MGARFWSLVRVRGGGLEGAGKLHDVVYLNKRHYASTEATLYKKICLHM